MTSLFDNIDLTWTCRNCLVDYPEPYCTLCGRDLLHDTAREADETQHLTGSSSHSTHNRVSGVNLVPNETPDTQSGESV